MPDFEAEMTVYCMVWAYIPGDEGSISGSTVGSAAGGGRGFEFWRDSFIHGNISIGCLRPGDVGMLSGDAL